MRRHILIGRFHHKSIPIGRFHGKGAVMQDDRMSGAMVQHKKHASLRDTAVKHITKKLKPLSFRF